MEVVTLPMFGNWDSCIAAYLSCRHSNVPKFAVSGIVPLTVHKRPIRQRKETDWWEEKKTS